MTAIRPPSAPRLTTALKVAGVYILAATLWIAFSDRLLAQLVQDAGQLSRWQTLKGWLFVVATGGLLFAYLQRSLRRQPRRLRSCPPWQGLPGFLMAKWSIWGAYVPGLLVQPRAMLMRCSATTSKPKVLLLNAVVMRFSFASVQTPSSRIGVSGSSTSMATGSPKP
jgi:hypothetical protein